MHLPARFVVAVSLVLLPATASAYETKKTPGGKALHWAAGEIELAAAATPAPATVSGAVLEQAARVAAATWQATLAEVPVGVHAVAGGAGVPHDGQDGVNQVRWAVAAADPDVEDGQLARTFIAYRTADGQILDADVVLNAVDFTWTTDPARCGDQYDVESALTHELGHLLGLAHSIGHPDATMFATADACETAKRDLTGDDRAGIDELYRTPPAEAAGCAAGGGDGGLVGAALVLIALAAAATRRQRRRAAAAVTARAAPLTMLAAATPAEASAHRRLPLARLGARAALVARGRVVAVTAAADDAFATDTTIVVGECLAGACGQTLTVRTLGGEQGGVGLWVDGEASLPVGAEVVVYLRRDRARHLRVLGGVQGAFLVVEASGAIVAVRDLRAHVVLDAAAPASVPAPGALETFDLDDLRRSTTRR